MSHTSEEYQVAIEAGKSLFMQQGFKEVSIADIVRATGLNRYSIYSAFGAKIDFFDACLKDYCETAIDNLNQKFFLSSLSPSRALRESLFSAVDSMKCVGGGCLVTENFTQMTIEAPQLADYCIEYFSRKESLHRALFEKAEQAGLLNAHITPESAAAAVIIFKCGLSNEIKRTPDTDKIKQKITDFVNGYINQPA